MTNPPSETGLPQAVQERTDAATARIRLRLRQDWWGGSGIAPNDVRLLLEAYDRALEGRAQAPAPDWQPIETCPVEEDVWIGGGGGCPWVQKNRLRDFRHAGKAYGWLGDPRQPTHWMPYVVPAPPSTGAATPTQEK